MKKKIFGTLTAAALAVGLFAGFGSSSASAAPKKTYVLVTFTYPITISEPCANQTTVSPIFIGPYQVGTVSLGYTTSSPGFCTFLETLTI